MPAQTDSAARGTNRTIREGRSARKGTTTMPYSLQGQQIPISPEPQVVDGRTYVPLREIIDGLGGTISWDNDAKQATATIDRWVARVTLGDPNVDVSGTPVVLQAPPFVDEEGRLWVPASFFRDAYGYRMTIEGSNISIGNPFG
jgi:hypothetical protein